MTNYNDTRVYLSKRAEMCIQFSDCSGCPLANNKYNLDCNMYEKDYPDEAIADVKAWYTNSSTYKDDFFDKFPNAPKTSDGYPLMNPCLIYPEIKRCKNDCDLKNSNDCWNIKKWRHYDRNRTT